MIHQTCGIYAGSFDPPTNGHLWMMQQGVHLFDRFIIAVGINPEKKPKYPIAQRLEWLLRLASMPFGPLSPNNIIIDSFENQFLAHYAAKFGATHLLRGIRDIRDFLFEQGARNINADLNPAVATVFLMPPRELADVSSSVVWGMIGPVGWQDAIKPYVPECVWNDLVKRG